jgi:hypothetical protein
MNSTFVPRTDKGCINTSLLSDTYKGDITMGFELLREHSPGIYSLDHRLLPEVRAMLAAMSSRMPIGGVRQRYQEILSEIAEDGKTEFDLTVYPIPTRVKRFFDQFVKSYGHSSILELCGEPTIFTEGISWYTAWLLFDSPLCAGQEFSTRAVQKKDWPICREAMGDAHLEMLHADWMSLYEDEVSAWTERLKSPQVRKELGIADKEPFRPALDRARAFLPGTIATGCAHASGIRERSRVIQTGMLLAQRANTDVTFWQSLIQAYKEALPGMADMGMREPVYSPLSLIPDHLNFRFSEPTMTLGSVGLSVLDQFCNDDNLKQVKGYDRPADQKAYLDPIKDHHTRVAVSIYGSLASARDWHRHRTMYPWVLNIEKGIVFDKSYTPISPKGRERLDALMVRVRKGVLNSLADNNEYKAMLYLPLGIRTRLDGCGGLRSVQYMMELRSESHGACFEYKAQALEALGYLHTDLQGRV